MTTTLLNLTPHPITLRLEDGGSLTVEPQPVPARLSVRRVTDGVLTTATGTVTLTRTVLGHAVEHLPAAADGVVLVVSRLVADALPDRDDVVFPDDLVRGSSGQVTGARSLGRTARR